jgi:glycosyltransferase involved in cell wall biosynthesis
VAPQDKSALFSDLPNVQLSPDLTDEELLYAYQQSSCLLMTVEAATANNAILEALACGLPLVAEDVGGIAEYSGPDSARLCRVGDAKGLVAAIVELSRNPELWQTMSLCARRRAEALNWPEVQRHTEAVYANVLAQFRNPESPHGTPRVA